MKALIPNERDIHKNRFYYEYIEKECKARYTIFGAPTEIAKVISVIENEYKNSDASVDKITENTKDFADYRPSYPRSLMEFIGNKLLNQQLLKVADIDCGIGRMSHCLLDMDYEVYGVEPNEDLRKVAEEHFLLDPSFVSVDGTAENTTLQSNFFDAIVCAESFNRFDDPKTIMEFKRILKPDCYVFLIWNTFSEENLCAKDLDALNMRLCPKYKSRMVNPSNEKHPISINSLEKITFNNIFNVDLETMLGGILSASYTPNKGEPNYQKYVDGIVEIYEKYQNGGHINAIFKTECYYGKL